MRRTRGGGSVCNRKEKFFPQQGQVHGTPSSLQALLLGSFLLPKGTAFCITPENASHIISLTFVKFAICKHMNLGAKRFTWWKNSLSASYFQLVFQTKEKEVRMTWEIYLSWKSSLLYLYRKNLPHTGVLAHLTLFYFILSEGCGNGTATFPVKLGVTVLSAPKVKSALSDSSGYENKDTTATTTACWDKQSPVPQENKQGHPVWF